VPQVALRNDAVLEVLQIGVVVFPGTGVQDNLADKARMLGIPVFNFCPNLHTPAISTVHAVLDRHGLVKRRTRRRNRAEGTTLSRPVQPNDLWCGD
jgi:hypothetical protein